MMVGLVLPEQQSGLGIVSQSLAPGGIGGTKVLASASENIRAAARLL